jgi:hypothetical protein
MRLAYQSIGIYTYHWRLFVQDASAMNRNRGQQFQVDQCHTLLAIGGFADVPSGIVLRLALEQLNGSS